MYDSQKIAERIKSRAKQQCISISQLLLKCNLGKNTIDKMLNGSDILTQNFAKLADYLECSVDYLLGRTDVPEVNRGDVVKKTEVKFVAEMPVSVPPKVVKRKRHT